nr:hypothetical protein [Chromobacterium sp. ASV5]
MHALPATRIQHRYSYVNVLMPDPPNLAGVVKPYKVGQRMDARLNPDDVVVGSATGPNWTWMQALRQRYAAANVVRGHLLNHDLGGRSVEENLYPISTSANGEHSRNVEVHVKEALADTKRLAWDQPVEYSVQVQENAAHDPAAARFVCDWEYGPSGGRVAQTYTVTSNLQLGSAYSGRATGPKLASWDHDKGGSLAQERIAFAGLSPRVSAEWHDATNPAPALEPSVEAPGGHGGLPEWWKNNQWTLESWAKAPLLEALAWMDKQSAQGKDTAFSFGTLPRAEAEDIVDACATPKTGQPLAASVWNRYWKWLQADGARRGWFLSNYALVKPDPARLVPDFVQWAKDELLT